MKYEAAQFRHGNVVVRQPGAEFVVAFDTIEQAERYADSRNQQLKAALDIEDVVAEDWSGDVGGRLTAILDKMHGPDELWAA